MHIPLFRISFNNKSSLVFGTNHWCKLGLLDNKIKNIILNKKNIICENNIIKFINKEPLKIYKPIENFNNSLYLNIPINKNHMRNHFDINIIKYINCELLTRVLNKILHENYLYFYKYDDLNLNFLSEIIISMLYANGLDNQILNYYKSNNKKTYGLDDIHDEEFIQNIEEYYKILKKSIKKSIYFSFEYYKDYIQKDFTFLKENFDLKYKNIFNPEYILNKRNDIWLEKIINYHNKLEDPIFVIGYGHLMGQYDLLKKLSDKVKDIKIEIYDRNNHKFSLYK